ncbi:MAG: Calx-beta domain-containing protein, partial [Roseiflexaceae bacterium]
SWIDAKPLFSENPYNAVIAADSNNPLHGREVFGRVSRGYYSSRLDLSTLVGQNVRFRFRIGTDEFGDGLGWFIDDMRLYTCDATPPSVSLPANVMPIGENGGSIAVQLTLSGVTDQTVSVPFTVSGTADPASDYRLTSHSFSIPAGSASGQVVIELTNDVLEEPAETVILTLGTPTNATLGASTQATVAIQDNDTIYFRYLPLLTK